MENLPAVVPWLRGRDHNLYNGLAKLYPESRFREETRRRIGGGVGGEQTLPLYGRCIIIATRLPPHTDTRAHAQPDVSRATFPAAFYSRCGRTRARITIANKAIRRLA
jgi:hypothetical protein